MTPTIDTIKQLIDKAGRSFTGASWTSGPDNVVAALERGNTRRAAEPDAGLDVPNDGSMFFGGLRRRWEDLLRDCLAAARAEEQDPAVVAELLDEALDLQRENAEYVRDCAVECREYGAEAVKALDLGMIDEAIAMLENAASLEATFGDAPSWGPALAEARAYAATLADEDEEALAFETGDELTADGVDSLGAPVRIVIGAEAIEPDARNPDALYIYRDGSVVACYEDSNYFYGASLTSFDARQHYTFRDPVPSTPEAAWDIYVGSQSVREFIDNGGNVDDYTDGAPTCEALTTGERARVAHLLAQHIAAQC